MNQTVSFKKIDRDIGYRNGIIHICIIIRFSSRLIALQALKCLDISRHSRLNLTGNHKCIDGHIIFLNLITHGFKFLNTVALKFTVKQKVDKVCGIPLFPTCFYAVLSAFRLFLDC